MSNQITFTLSDEKIDEIFYDKLNSMFISVILGNEKFSKLPISTWGKFKTAFQKSFIIEDYINEFLDNEYETLKRRGELV